MRYPALEYQPGIAAEQLSPLAPPREPRRPKRNPNAPTQDANNARPLDNATSISDDGVVGAELERGPALGLCAGRGDGPGAEQLGDLDRVGAGQVIPIADLRAPQFGVRFSGVGGSMPEALAEAVSLISGGQLHIPVDRAYGLAEAAQAHVDSQAGHTRGRRVILV